MKPLQIKVNSGNLIIGWDDGTSWQFTVRELRDECPCAGCKGETVLLKTFAPAPQPPKTDDSYKISAIHPVGGYAIQINWKDGHDTGLYSWEYLAHLREKQK